MVRRTKADVWEQLPRLGRQRILLQLPTAATTAVKRLREEAVILAKCNSCLFFVSSNF